MQKPNDCQGCSLVNIGRSFSDSEGSPNLGIAIYGEALEHHEATEGMPFRPNGESGSLITSIIEKITIQDLEGKHKKLKRSDFIWDNVVKCQPPSNKLIGQSFEKDAIEHCRIYNHRSIDRRDVRVVLALGAVAFKELTGIEGKKRGIEDVRGYVFKSNNKLVLGSLHPSHIRHGNARYTGALIHDVKKAIAVASGRFTSYDSYSSFTSPDFVLTGKLEALVSLYYKLRDNPQLPIYYDIENPYTKLEEEEDKGEGEDEENEETESSNSSAKRESPFEITSIQFAYNKHWAITIPWEKP